MALPDVIQLTAGSNRTSGLSAVSIAIGSNYLGSAIDNSGNLDLYADVEVVWSCSTAPTADKVLEVYLLYAQDGTNYEDGAGAGTGSGDIDPKAPLIGAVPVYGNTSSHRYVIRGVPLEPLPFKVLVKNKLDQTAMVTVNVKTYREQVVD